MKPYIGTKVINEKPMTRLEYNDFRGWTVPADENPADEGYLVEYVDGGQANTKEYAGYVSWSPKEVFERAYRENGKLTFGDALVYLKEGKKVARSGWNEKNMWLVYMPPFNVEHPNERTQAHGITEAFDCGGYIVIWTAQGVWQLGWLASQNDMLAEDWSVIELTPSSPSVVNRLPGRVRKKRRIHGFYMPDRMVSHTMHLYER